MPVKKYQYIIFTRCACSRQFENNFNIEKIMKLYRKHYNIIEIEIYKFSQALNDYQYLFTIVFEKGLI